MLTAIVLALFLLAPLIDGLTILKRTAKKVKIVYFSLMLVSFCVLMLYSLSIPVPSPAGAITDAIEAIFHLKG